MKRVLIRLINFYQKNISRWIRDRHNVMCKYYPTCSEYTKQAIEKYGAIKGIALGVKRICKCNFFSKGGVDLLK